jgi:L-ascorbate metabolism protein UlaG (beta-lactamase superfamily)
MAVCDNANVVVISSDNDTFHCRADLIPGDPMVIKALEMAQAVGKGVEFTAIEAMEALNHKYHDPDQNGMYRFVVDGVSIGHMGDIGNALSEEHLKFIQALMCCWR